MAERMGGERGGRRSRNRDEAPRKRARVLDGVKVINTSDPDFLQKFVTEHGKIIPARLTGASARQQRQLKKGVRRMRTMGLLP